jgi:hypothetical protein
MKTVVLTEHFDGDFLADGHLANKFRFCEIEPLFTMHEQVVFDFQGISNITDSFANGLIGNLAELHPAIFSDKIRFRNCTLAVRSALQLAIALGLQRARSRA